LVSFILTSNGVLIDEAMRRWEVNPITINNIPDNTYETAIVLGGVTDPERTPMDRLYFHKGADRITHAIHLYKEGKVKNILFTGGNSKVFEDSDRNNQAILNFYIMCGVAKEDITIENKSRNTHENAVNSYQLLDPNKKYILITSAFHMRRAEACFRKEGLLVLPFSCDFNSQKDEDRFSVQAFIPSSEAMTGWEILLKEWIGMLAYKISGYI
jgi:uncharacterized SAM-binding protein YcdF (DUF218 family)